MKKVYIFLLLLFSIHSFSQNAHIKKIENYLLETSNAIKRTNLDSAIYYANEGLKKATEIDNAKYQAKCNMAIAQIQFAKGNTKEAYSKAKDALLQGEKIKDYEIILAANLQMANVHFYNMEDEKAMELYKKNEAIAEKHNIIDKSTIKTYCNTGLVFYRSTNNAASNMKNAELYFSKAVASAEKINDLEEKHIAMCFLAGVYLEKGDFDKAIETNLASYTYFKETNNIYRIPHALYGLGEAYISKKDFASAEKYFIEFVKLNEETKNNNGLAKANWALAKLYNSSNQLNKAAAAYEKSIQLFKQDENIERGALSQAVSELSDVYYKLGDYKTAFNYLDEYITIEDSIKRDQNEIAVSELETKYQTEKKEQEIKLLSAQNELAQKQKYLYIGLLGLLVLISGLVFYAYRNKIKTAQKISELNEMKSRFFANISHEFRTPLTLIKSPIQSLQTSVSDEKQLNQLALINKNSDRMLELVDQLLELSKIDSGKLNLILKEGNISSYLKSIIESFEFQANENQIQFNSTIQNTADNHFFDKDIIQKIVTNLLSNAFKYTPANHNVGFKSTVENETLQLTVSNSGVNLKKEDLPKLFERFYQKNESQNGVGIGLALVKELVDLYKGTIETSIENDSLLFTISLPLSVNQKENILISKDTSSSEINTNELDEQLPILLIVDDNAEIRTVLKDIFSDEYTILEAEDGEIALKLARKEIPDCIISDVMMPKLDGFQFTKAIKTNELTSFIPVILLTAKTSDEAHLEGLQSTADAFLTKPFNNEIVKAAVNQLIAERKKLQNRYSKELILKPVDIVINSVDEKFLAKLQTVLDTQLSNSEFTSEDFATKVGMSRMQLHRKLKSLLGVSATEFIRNERLKNAADLLKKGNGNISEIAYSVGFSDVSYFSKCFKELYGCTPTEFSEQK